MGEEECITRKRTGGGSERRRSCVASLVATHVTAIDIATRQTGSLLGRSTHWIKPASPPVVCLALSLLPPSYKGAKPLVESPRRGHTPFGTPRRVLPGRALRVPVSLVIAQAPRSTVMKSADEWEWAGFSVDLLRLGSDISSITSATRSTSGHFGSSEQRNHNYELCGAGAGLTGRCVL